MLIEVKVTHLSESGAEATRETSKIRFSRKRELGMTEPTWSGCFKNS